MKMLGVKWVTKAQFEKMLEQRCQRILGITLAQFRKNMRRGKYKKQHAGPIVELKMLANN